MLEAERDEYLGYDKYERSSEPNYHNGTKNKRVRSKYGEFDIEVPQDRQSTFEPKVVQKRPLYLVTFEATKKWTMSLKNWGKVYGELSIMYPGRLPESEKGVYLFFEYAPIKFP